MLDLTYSVPKLDKLQNIAKYETQAKEYTQMLAKEANSISDRPSSYHILTDYYNHLITYYAGNPTLLDAYFLCQYSDTMITIFDVLNKKIFKGGLQKIPLKEDANQEEEKLIDQFLLMANQNNEQLVEVLKEVELGANWSNLRVLLLLKEYKARGGELVTVGIKEIIHIDPLTVEPLKDGRGRLGHDKQGRKLYFSLKKRDAFVYDKDTDGVPNLSADYRVNTDNGYMYYNRTELIVKKKFPFNPVFALKNKILSMIAQDKHIRSEYSEGKPTKKLIVMKGRNLDEVKESAKEYSKATREKPNKQHIFMMGGVENNQNIFETIDLVKSMEEMQATDFRNEFRNAMGAPYGVSPIYQNDASTSGGLNNEGLQITVTNEAIEANKDYYNQLLKFIFNITLGIKDWEIKTYPNEEQDDAYIEDLLKKKLENAEKITKMGGKVIFKPDNKDKNYTFIYEDTDLEKPEDENVFSSGGQTSFDQLGDSDVQKEEKKKKKPKKTPLEEVLDEYTKEMLGEAEKVGK